MEDPTGTLTQAFSRMATSDRDALIRQFQQILGGNHVLTPDACAFFLDMNNWNVQAALGAYYDYGTVNSVGSLPPEYATVLPSMQFVQDITIGEGESVPPLTSFVKTWRVRNNGHESWPVGTYIGFMEGDKLTSVLKSSVQPLGPGEEGNISVEMMSPAKKGIYQSRWQLNTSLGIPFGESIWCIITVDDWGILDITQHLASTPIGFASNPNHNMNPFSGSVQFDTEKNAEMQGESSNMFQHSGCSGNDQSASEVLIATVSRLPQDWSASTVSTSMAVSQPINIRKMDETPDAPPCTPCTPPP
uniref:N_BRCA1_IG domain-containing protein n=1 Tax=Syphacia muris TaxID=451379 RepID=A0A0N5AEY4_9BILA